MTIISFIAVLVLFIIAIGVWWHYFLGTPNPPLSQVSVSIQNSSTPATTSASSPSAVVVTNPLVAGENPPLAEEPLSVDGITFNVEVASSMTEQARGLSFRPSLSPNNGMLFVFGSGSVQTFWMQGMKFPLDMIWISGTAIVGFAQDVPMPTPGWNLPIYTSPGNTDKVLEVNAGTVAKYNIKVGDTVTIGAVR